MASWLTGNTVQTSNGASAFWTVIQYSTVSQGEDGAYIEWFPYFEVRWGDFWSTRYSTSWGRSGTIEGPEYNPYAPGGTSRVYVEYGKSTYLSASVTDGLNRTSSVGANVSPAVPTWAPNATTNGTATRNSDSQVTLAWTNNGKAARPYTVLKVQRRANGGAWSDIATLAGSATGYIDQTTSAGNYYEYRTYVSNSAGEATGELGTVHMTPTAPTNVQWERVGNTDVKLTMTNTANTATALEVQYRAANSSTWQALTTVSGKVTETTVSVGGGEWYLRVRNTRDSLASAWVETTKVVTIVAPNPPTLNSPASSAVVRKDQASVSLTWKHNPLDGSAQTAAQVRYKIGTGSYTTQNVTTAQSYSLALASIAVNSAITWQVRTKGAHADYSAWSEERTFTVRQVPTVSITTPTATVSNTPVNFGFTYNDVSGELRNATVTVSNANGVLFTKSIGNATHGAIERDEYLLDDGGTYTLTINVQSTSTLTSSAQSTFLVKYKKPTSATLARQYDTETGAVNLSVDPMEQTFEYWSDLPTNEQVQIQYGEDSGVHEMSVNGKAYAWNQLVKNESMTKSITLKASAGSLVYSGFGKVDATQGHKYLIMLSCSDMSAVGVIGLYNLATSSAVAQASVFTNNPAIVTATSTKTANLWIYQRKDVTLDITANVFDLTLIYGAGNEPTTVAQFRADYPESYYPYDAGSVKVVEGKNLFDPSAFTDTGTYMSVKLPSDVGVVSVRPKQGASVPSGIYLGLTENGASTGAVFWQVTNGAYQAAREHAAVETQYKYFFVYPKTFGNSSVLDYFDIQFEQGTHATEYVPYGSIGVKSEGRNLLDLSGVNTVISGVTYTSGDNGVIMLNGTKNGGGYADIKNTSIHLKAGIEYTLSARLASGTEEQTPTVYLLSGGTSVVAVSPNASGSTVKATVTPTVDTVVDKVRFASWTDNKAYANAVFEVQFEYGTVATPYTPYVQPTQSSIDLQGHNLASLPDGTRDELTVDAAGNVRLVKRVGSVDMGTLNYGKDATSQADMYWASLPDKASGNTPMLSSAFVYNSSMWSQEPGSMTVGGYHVISEANFFTAVGQYASVAAFKTAMSGVMLYYPLETPQTIDLGTIDPLEFIANDGTASYEVLTNIQTKQGVTTYNGGLPTVSYDLQRVNPDGTAVTLAQDLTGHTDYLDRFAPCNIGYEYRVVTYAESGAFRETLFTSKFVTPYWYLMAGNLTAKAKYNPSASQSLECADASLVRYAGRRYPVLYEADALNDSYSAGGIVIGKDGIEPFRGIQRDGGKAVYKSNDGDVVHVHGSTEVTRNIGTPASYEISVSMERIDGGVL